MNYQLDRFKKQEENAGDRELVGRFDEQLVVLQFQNVLREDRVPSPI